MLRRRIAFTIVELLVVIAIIVLLLALLSPALNKAIYEARLAQCGANLHAVGVGVLQYAFQAKRRYPYRAEVAEPGGREVKPNYISIGDNNTFADDRRVLAGFVAVNKQLNDPLAEAIDIENAQPPATVEGAYNLYYSFHYGKEATDSSQGGQRKEGNQGMYKLGDRLSVLSYPSYGPANLTNYRPCRFDLLASDQDNLSPAPTPGLPPFAYSSHPDRLGKMHNVRLENEAHPSIPAVPWTLTRWEVMVDWRRGELDNNFLRSDGSVLLVRNIVADSEETWFGDPRLTPLPTYTHWGIGGNTPIYFAPRAE